MALGFGIVGFEVWASGWKDMVYAWGRSRVSSVH